MKDGHIKLIIKIKRIIFLIFIVNILIACSQDPDCFIADSIKLVTSIKIGSRDYLIYLRISGFHEKEIFYELYENKPTFDECKQSDVLSISDVHVDLSRGVVSRLIVDDKVLHLVYSNDKAQKFDLEGIPIEVKETKLK